MSDKIVELEIDSFAFGGAGVGRLPDGKVCFVRGTIPGERVKVRVTDDKASYSYGRLVEVLKRSPHRIEPVCPLAIDGADDGRECPGCSYLHVDYETELQWKQRQLEGFLLRGGLVTSDRIREPEGAQHRTGWRNKIR